jgi:DNA repair protein RadC
VKTSVTPNGRPRTFTINDLPASEKPRERLQQRGARALSEQELIAVILGRGVSGESVTVTAQRLFDHFGSLRGIANATVEELCQIRGIKLAKASQIKAVFELAGRLASNPDGGKRLVKTPEDAVEVVSEELRGAKKECFLALLLTTRGRLIKVSEISVGTLDSSLVHPREVFKPAMLASAASVVFVHNHPSGDPTPSAEDMKMTERLVEVGKLIGIEVLDHVIVCDGGSTSMKRKGLL